MYEMLNIAGIDKATLLHALVDHELFKLDEAVEIVTGLRKGGLPLSFDYVAFRAIKADISGDFMDPRLYDRDAGKDRASAIVARLERKGRLYRGVSTHEPGPSSVTVEVVGVMPARPLPPRFDLANSWDGFAWGYGGSGPAQLALAILVDAFSAAPAPVHEAMRRFDLTPERMALQLHQPFKAKVISQLRGSSILLSWEGVIESLRPLMHLVQGQAAHNDQSGDALPTVVRALLGVGEEG